MVDSIFQTLSAEASAGGVVRRTGAARDWFMKRLKSIARVDPSVALADSALIKKNAPLPGRMFMFIYDPKGKGELPYYDKFPLILMVGPAPDGFYGLNLHYLPPLLRAKFLDKLMVLASSTKLDENTKIVFSYKLLTSASKFKEFAPCFKHYLTRHVKSKIEMVPAPEWDIAVFMPTERFAGKSAAGVWLDSRQMAGI